MRTPRGQDFSSVWSCLLELLPQTHQKGSNVMNQKSSCFFLVNWERQTPRSWNLAFRKYRWKVLLQARWGFRVTLWPHGGNLDPIWGPIFFFLLNFTRILWYFWDLRLALFDIPKDVVFPELLVFSNIFGFPAVDWAQKWTKTVIFQCVPFEPNFKILKNFSNNELVLLDYLWSKFH